MKALIDGDIVAYRNAWAADKENSSIAIWRCNEMLKNILSETGADSYQVYISDSTENNWRTKLYPEYKANRNNQPKPQFLDLLREYMLKEWDAEIAMEMEADDALGITQDKPKYVKGSFFEDGEVFDFKVETNTIICSIDKDLLQVPGLHYNFVKKEFQEVTPFEGLRYFYNQVLTGDTTDNIKGCIKIGTVKATQALLGKGTEAELFAKVKELYLRQYKIYQPDWSEQQVMDYLLMTGRVLKIRQEEDEKLWNFPDGSGDNKEI